MACLEILRDVPEIHEGRPGEAVLQAESDLVVDAGVVALGFTPQLGA
jgi:hypothetical protein